ncbi:MAG: ankyrin repeat domain-containing protein [Alphaproteobacteria bacterium]|nr:ankyrin repeat domain-containing protein [Alphaproteobacteria bacterium]
MSHLGSQEQEFLKAVQSGSVGTVRKLLAEGYSPNVAATRPDITPLHEAVIQGDLLMVKVLVAGGAEMNVSDRQGDFPLDTAIYEDRDAIAKYLRGQGARRYDEDDLSPPVPAPEKEPAAARADIEAARRAKVVDEQEMLQAHADGESFRLPPRRKNGPRP